MSSGLAKQLAAGLGALVLWSIGVLQQASLKAERWTLQEVFLWQWRLSLRVALLAMLFFVAAHHWHWWRLWVNGPLSDSLLQEVLQERESLGAHKSKTVRFRCFVPASASAAGLLPYLNAASLASAQAWIEPGLPWLEGDWWVVDVVDQRITKMSRMDKALLQPHPRMKEAQCAPANAMKLINAGVNGQGQREFQVIDLNRSAAF
ncbi:hypothetical protein [Hydrogenophaga sp. SL48]|jgi:hypothetical protein|uniref:hypothetical protein n=1 Tax=Hydrogenophaga sp. SL48 TaxID=2806347 RepID=UPI001F2BE453|nr:hypothetical protein [Hydrogenophaga sp. SL48]UJW80366.1 hypothetical protein IM738_21335 [Hydrogenophaga sp. SL48]